MALDDSLQNAYAKDILSTLKDSGYSGTINNDRTIFIYETIPHGCLVGFVRRFKGNQPVGMVTIDVPRKTWTFQAGDRYESLKAILTPLAKKYEVHLQKNRF